MLKEKIIEEIKKLKPVEKMEITMELVIFLFEETGLSRTDKLWYDELKFTLERLRNEH